MPNINKVVYDGTTLIDLTSTTATADKIKQGYGAFGKDGVWMDGTAVRSDDGYVYQDEEDYVVLDDEAGVGVGVTPLSVSANGTYNAGSRRAYNPVTVNVQPALQSKTVTPTESQQTITPDSGKYGLSQVVVNGIDAGYVGSSVPRKSSADVGVSFSYTSNAVYDYVDAKITAPAGYYSSGINTANMHIIPNISGMPTQSAVTITPTETRQTAVSSRRWLTGDVTVAGISSTYVGSGIPTKSSADLTRSGATVTVPAGYYSGDASKAVATMTLPTAPTTTSTGTLKVTIDRSTATRYLNIPTGYNGASAFYKISSVPNMTLPTTTATTSTGTLKSTIARSTATRYINIPTGYNSASGTYKIEAVANGTATTPATTITAAPVITVDANGLITATNSKTQNVTPTISAGYVAAGTAGTITVGGASTYQLTTKSSADLTISNYSVVAPAGYYSGNATVNLGAMIPTTSTTSSGELWDTIHATNTQIYVNMPKGYNDTSRYARIYADAGKATTPATTITTNPTISINSSGLITATNSKTQSVTPTVSAGYVSTGTAGTITVSGSNTQQLTTKGATTYTPTTTNQTIASGTYLTGVQTISGDSNLVAENIKSGVTIFGVEGTHKGGKTYSATITQTGNAYGAYARYPSSTGTKYYTADQTFEIEEGQEIYFYARGERTTAQIYLNGEKVADDAQTGSTEYNYIVPANTNVAIKLSYGSSTTIRITEKSDFIAKTVTPTKETQIVLPDNVNTYTYDCISGTNGYNKWFDISDWEWFDLDNSVWVRISGNYKLYNLNNELVAMIVFSPSQFHITNGYVITSDYSFSMSFDSASSWGSTSNSCVFHTGDNNSSTSAPEYPSIYLSANVNFARAVFELQIEILGDPIIYVEPQNINSTDYTMTVDYSSLLIGDTLSLYGKLGTWDGSSGTTYCFDSSITWTGEYRKIQQGSGYYVEINPALTTNNTTIHVPNSPLYATFGIYKQKPSTYDGMSQVTVNPIPSAYIMPTGTLSISAEGSFNVASYDNVSVNTGLYSLITRNTINSMYLDSTYSRIGTGAFYGAYISYVEGSKVSYVGQSAFQIADIRRVSFPELKTIFDYGFYTCRYLSDLGSMPLLSSIGAYAFYSCSSMTTINFPSASVISHYAFANCTKLSSVSLPALSTVGLGAFYACTSLTTIELPNRTLVSSSAFGNCKNLLSVSLPNATSLYAFVFMGCSSLTSVYAPKITFLSDSRFRSCIGLINNNNLIFSNTLSAIGSSAFANCSGLKSVSFSTVAGISTGAFYQCYNLESISFPALTFVGNGAFSYCSSLKTAFLPTVVSLYSYAFGNCWSLTSVVLRDIQNFTSNNVFNSCYNLLSLYLLSTSVVPLSSIAVFNSTPISNYTTSTGGVYGSIFVPESLYTSYKTAVRWSTYSSRFVSLTDAEVSAILGS